MIEKTYNVGIYCIFTQKDVELLMREAKRGKIPRRSRRGRGSSPNFVDETCMEDAESRLQNLHQTLRDLTDRLIHELDLLAADRIVVGAIYAANDVRRLRTLTTEQYASGAGPGDYFVPRFLLYFR